MDGVSGGAEGQGKDGRQCKHKQEEKQKEICPVCKNRVSVNDLRLECNLCKFWHHIKCENIDKEAYEFLMKN